MTDPKARSSEGSLGIAASLMREFAERTGLTSERSPKRYLWTDAFAVCNLLGLARVTGDNAYQDLARRLVDQVHRVLGRFRPDDSRTGWISGLDEQEGAAHPTRGGLRIGKSLPERRPDEPLDPEREWDRDGQYFHYLTKWMHALDQMSRATGEARFNLWARELAETAHASFTRGAGSGGRGMVWKMSTDLTRPLVPSMGQHDPLDGLVTCVQLEATVSLLGGVDRGPSLQRPISDFATMLRGLHLRTADPLGVGGLLSDAYRVAQLTTRKAMAGGSLLEALLRAAKEGASHCAQLGDLQLPASARLAFRELGLAIGLHGLRLLRESMHEGCDPALQSDNLRALVESISRHDPLGSAIVSFWLIPDHQRSSTSSEHRDINEVMLATTLEPKGFLVLRDPS
jgi:hypothetical protein